MRALDNGDTVTLTPIHALPFNNSIANKAYLLVLFHRAEIVQHLMIRFEKNRFIIPDAGVFVTLEVSIKPVLMLPGNTKKAT